jgi:hypothetical protein
MPGCRYTKEILVDAVAASTSIAGVLRHLGMEAGSAVGEP